MAQSFIPLSAPNLKGNELKYLTEAIHTEWVSSGGPFVTEFENQIAAYTGSKGAVSVQSGTAGLHLSLIAAGVTAETEVIVPTLTFIAAVNPIRYLGADPIFMDCDDDFCMDAEKLAYFCEHECYYSEGKLINNLSNKQVKAILVVHVFGNMANMIKIMKVARRYQLKVIEDATEALGTFYTGGTYSGRYAGTIGDIGVYSFNGNKIITTGGGGMVVSNQPALLKQISYLSTQAKGDDIYYTHNDIGYNYRMTNLQAAVGLAQLEQLEQFITVKANNYALYNKEIISIEGLSLQNLQENIRSNYWFYALRIQDTYHLNRDELISHLSRENIQSRPIWGLIHRQKPYQNFQHYMIEKAEGLYERVVNIPCSSNLTPEEVLRVISALK